MEVQGREWSTEPKRQRSAWGGVERERNRGHAGCTDASPKGGTAARGCWGNDELDGIREIDGTEERHRRGGLRGMANWTVSERTPCPPSARGSGGDHNEPDGIRGIVVTKERHRRGGLRGMANWTVSERTVSDRTPCPLRAPLREAVGKVTTNRTVSEGSL